MYIQMEYIHSNSIIIRYILVNAQPFMASYCAVSIQQDTVTNCEAAKRQFRVYICNVKSV